MDADDSHPPGLMPRMIRLIEEGSDVVIASRYQPGSYRGNAVETWLYVTVHFGLK